jgi:hypothetical protein
VIRGRQLPASGLPALLLATLASTASAACTEPELLWQAAGLSQGSRWDELTPSGQSLVHESGRLDGLEFSGRLRCGAWQFAAHLTQLEGSRDYQGQTSTGIAVNSRSELRQRQARLQTSLDLTPTWQLGGRLSHQTHWRDIASAGAASGYPERFDWTLLEAGAQWQTGLGPGQLQLAAWAGAPLQSSMALTLPGRDPASLSLGAMRQFELSAAWRGPLRPGWQFQVDIAYRRTEIEQGASSVITRAGVPVGVAHQPRTVLRELPLAIRISYSY